MKRIPGYREVDASLRNVAVRVKDSLKGLNHLAAKAISKGRYEEAETFMVKGREVHVFLDELQELHEKWRAFGRLRRTHARKGQATPLWKYYQPVLKAIVALGGDAKRTDFESKVEELMRSEFLPGDSDRMAKGQMRWQIMIRRARRHLIKEQWLDGSAVLNWKITPKGRKAAESQNS